MMKAAAKNKIIIALDVDSLESAQELVALLRSSAGAFKIGKQLFTRYGPQAIAIVHDAGGAVFLDLKFHDIPNTVARASAEVVRHGVLMFNIHAMGGYEMMQQSVAAVRKMAENLGVRRPLVLAVTVLTSLAQSDLAAVGITAGMDDQVRRLAKLAKSAGADGVVASPQEIEIIKTACGPEFLVVTPGVRPKAAQGDDQKRVLTPGEAIRKGADYIVVGRPVTEAPDPLVAVKEIIKEIEN
jgi:orotidine-5'-phosphate decarboxylase